MATYDAGSSAAAQSDFQRQGSSNDHGRSSSRDSDASWRQQNNGQQQMQDQQQPMGNFVQNQNPNANVFQPGHRVWGSMDQSLDSIEDWQFPAQPQLDRPFQGQNTVSQMFAGAENEEQLDTEIRRASEALAQGARNNLQLRIDIYIRHLPPSRERTSADNVINHPNRAVHFPFELACDRCSQDW